MHSLNVTTQKRRTYHGLAFIIRLLYFTVFEDIMRVVKVKYFLYHWFYTAGTPLPPPPHTHTFHGIGMECQRKQGMILLPVYIGTLHVTT